MQQKPMVPSTQEQSFGQAVAMMRSVVKMSQRDFAAKLTEKGMPVDASAVSRIEKGTRSVRLVEALTIAEVLNTDLDWLVSGSKTPSQEFRAIRQRTNSALLELQQPVLTAAYQMWETRWFLGRHPELLADLRDEKHGSPETVDDYLDWVARRIESWVIPQDDYIITETQAEADQIADVFRRLILMHVGVENLSGEDAKGYGLAAFKEEENIGFDDEQNEA